MPMKTMSFKRTAAAAVTAAVLAVGGSVVVAAPAFASPTPATGPVTTISNLVVGIDNSSGRQVHIQYNFLIADPSLDSDSIVEVTDFNDCDNPTVIDRDVPLASPGGGISLYVILPVDGYVEVVVYSSNGTSAPLASAPAFASDTPVAADDTGANFIPDTPPTTGSLVVNMGGAVPQSTFQLYVNGAGSGAAFTVAGCQEVVHPYSGVPGDVLTLHDVDGDFDAATITIPGGVSAPTDPGAPTLPTTGVGPGSWYAGGFGLAALFAGGLLLLVQWRVRRRASALR
jgi:hypothetical protein